MFENRWSPRLATNCSASHHPQGRSGTGISPGSNWLIMRRHGRQRSPRGVTKTRPKTAAESEPEKREVIWLKCVKAVHRLIEFKADEPDDRNTERHHSGDGNPQNYPHCLKFWVLPRWGGAIGPGTNSQWMDGSCSSNVLCLKILRQRFSSGWYLWPLQKNLPAKICFVWPFQAIWIQCGLCSQLWSSWIFLLNSCCQIHCFLNTITAQLLQRSQVFRVSIENFSSAQSLQSITAIDTTRSGNQNFPRSW